MVNRLPDAVKELLQNEDPIAIQAIPDYVGFEDIDDKDLEQALPSGTQLEDLIGEDKDSEEVDIEEIDFGELNPEDIKYENIDVGQLKFLKPLDELHSYTSSLLAFVTSLVIALPLFISILITQNYISIPQASDIYVILNLIDSYYIYGYFTVSLSIGGAIATIVWHILSLPPAIRNEINMIIGLVSALFVSIGFSLIAGIGGPISFLLVLLLLIILLLAVLAGMLLSFLLIPYGLLSRDFRAVGVGIGAWVIAGVFIFLEEFLDATIPTQGMPSEWQIVASIYLFAIALTFFLPMATIGGLIDRSKLGENEYLYHYLIMNILDSLGKDPYKNEIDTKDNYLYKTSPEKARSDIVDGINLIHDINSISEDLDKIDELIRQNDYKEADEKLVELKEAINHIEDKEVDENTIIHNSGYDNKLVAKIDSINNKYKEMQEYLERKREQKRSLEHDLDPVNSELDRANSLISSNKFEEAKEILTKTESELSSINEKMNESQLEFEEMSDLLSEVERRKSSLSSKLDEGIKNRRNITDQVDLIQSKISDIPDYINDGRLKEAEETVLSLQSQITSARDSTKEYGFEDLEKELEKLENRCNDHVEDIDEKQREAERQRLQTEIESLRSKFENVSTNINKSNSDKVEERLKEIEADAERTKETADEYDFEELKDDLVLLLDDIELKYRKNERLRLLTEIKSLRSNLEEINALTGQGVLEKAQDQLKELEVDIAIARETATQYDFDELYDDLATLEQRRENHLNDVTKRLKSTPVPDTIPREPNITVDYDALTDKEAIGGGGNADVTKATLSTPDGDVTLAIKEPRMSGTLHTDAVRRMLEEAETWDKLDDHDHIVGVVDYGSEPIPWIAMEYMDAGHLGARRDELGIPQALWTAIAITKGVRHAHRRGVAHLDLKPENVLFRSVEDAWDVPKVTDWGLSKHLLDHSKSVEGLSPQYAAPEQFDEDFGSADDITDIYQLGAVFYELFTGRPPFEGKPAKAMHKVLHEEPTSPSEIADVPDGLDEILLTALAKEKDDRYESVLLLRNDLQDLYDET